MTARLLRSKNFRRQNVRFVALVLCAWISWLAPPALAQNVQLFDDNAESIAVVIGNKNYKRTVSVEFAHNDAEAMRDFLSRSLGFRTGNIFMLPDATLNDFNQMFGSERSPQSGQLWRAVKEGRSNVFVYFSGHGVPDIQAGQQFLLPSDGNPNQSESGFLLDTLYRNLELVKRKAGPNRQVVVMIDACFTGETGRKGESLLAASAPNFVPARPKTGSGVVKLLATSAALPANWDQENKLGLFTGRFLLGAAGLARASDARPDVSWAELRRFVIEGVSEGARRETGREQVPEIDEAALTLKPTGPVPAVERAYGRMRDEARWRAAEAASTVAALEDYVAHCGTVCAFRDRALDALDVRRDAADAEADTANWKRLSALGKYQEYLDGCGRICAYRDVAMRYLKVALPVAPARPPATTPGDPCSGAVTVSFPSRCAAPLTAAQERGLKPKDLFRECENCPEMVVVPAGSFTMGSPKDEKDRWSDDEGPQHVVTFKRPFAVGRLHVTVGQFEAFVRDTGFQASTTCYKWPSGKDGSWRNPGFAQDGSHPVVCVSWDDAKAYVDWMARKTGKPYRLLSEAEFEYAARGRTSPGTYPRFWFGDNESDLCRNANGADQKARDSIEGAKSWTGTVAPCNDDYAYTSPAGHYEPNAFGLYDMAGNAWQWTADCYHDSYNGAPSDGSASITEDCKNGRVGRGGSWLYSPRNLRAAQRLRLTGAYLNVGFRLARTLSP